MVDKDKAEPVGDNRGHDTKGSRKALGAMNAKLKAKIGRLERELAAYQQPQSADSLIVTVVDPDTRSTEEYVITESVVLSLWRRIEELERRNGVVMPDRKDEKNVHGAALMSAIAHNLCLDEFARLNGKEVGRG